MNQKVDINALIDRARKAMEEIKFYSQEQVDELTRVVAEKILEHATELSHEAVIETELGNVPHKILKHEAVAGNVYNSLIGKKTVGVIGKDKEKGIVEIAHPAGVIACISPTTNPTITPLGNGLMALKGKNAMIVAPHPRSKKVTHHTVELMREALSEVGAPMDLFQIIREPTIELSAELMSKSDLVIATGGPSLVKAAYSSGKPAFGVGPGNVQTILDEDFNVEAAVEMVMIARSFDNGLVCACAQSLIYPVKKEEEVKKAFKKFGVFFSDNEDVIDKFRKVLVGEKGPNPAVVGQTAMKIAELAGVSVPRDTVVIALKVNKSGAEELLAGEKICPVLAVFSYDQFNDALKIALNNLELAGKGHSVTIYSHNDVHILNAAELLPVSRVIINQPSIHAGGAPNCGLNPTASLGCGTWGNNIISENLTYKHLINISRIAYDRDDLSGDIWKK